jgi:gamma-glutamylcyclotransferase (GGCT)/AIG2-like uncharacterized protein YtfP
MNYIFVYGTLKRGEQNHQLIGHAEFIDVGYIRGCILFDLGGCPAMMPGGSRNGSVEQAAKGEIYAVKDEDLDNTLARLDALEQEGTLYIRVKLKVHSQAGGVQECITYLFIPSLQLDERVVEGGWWSCRSNWE